MASAILDDSSDIGDDEFLFRLVPSVYYTFGAVQPCTPRAFEPSPNDDEGISVTRAIFTTIEEFVRHFESTRRKPFLVVRLHVGEIRENEIAVIPKPSKKGLKGHSLIPDVGRHARRANKTRAKEKALNLAILASKPEALVYCHPDLKPVSDLPVSGHQR